MQTRMLKLIIRMVWGIYLMHWRYHRIPPADFGDIEREKNELLK